MQLQCHNVAHGSSRVLQGDKELEEKAANSASALPVSG